MYGTIALVFGTALLGLLAPSCAAAALPGPLVSVEWLAAHRSDVTVLDVREDLDSYTVEPVFEKDAKTGASVLVEVGGHIPGARLVDYANVRVERGIGGIRIKGMLPDRDTFQQLLRAAGIDAGRPIVIAAPGTMAEDMDTAARVYWSLKYYGEDAIAILDGGTAAWLQAGLGHEVAAPGTRVGNWSATAERPELLAQSADVEAAMKDGSPLIDARPLPFYLGLQRKPNVAAGRVAGAMNFPPDLRALPDGPAFRFLAADRYRRLLPRMGIDAAAPAITYCNTGHLAAGAWFILSELLGNRGTRLYDGSMTLWTAEGRPVVALR